MSKILASGLRIVGLPGYNGFKRSRQKDAIREQATAAVRATLAEKFLVQQLPASLRDVQCQGFSLNCGPGVYVTQCFMRLDPKDFDTVFDRARFRENKLNEAAKTLFERPVPGDFSTVTQSSASSSR